jgi:hypothetical protein
MDTEIISAIAVAWIIMGCAGQAVLAWITWHSLNRAQTDKFF